MGFSGFSIIILASIFIHLPLISAQVYHYRCVDTLARYTANSVFSTNLNLTLTSLITNATNAKPFYDTSTGQGTDESFGLFLCRGDVSNNACQSCVTSSSYEITIRCPNIKEAIIWYDRCMLRYGSNSTRFAQMEETPVVSGCDANANVSDPVQSNGTLVSLMNRLVKEAVNGASGKMFATGDDTWDFVNKVYGMVQCTPDISKSDCELCLSNTAGEISKLCYAKRVGRILKPSCNIWFDSGRIEGLFNTPELSKQSPSAPVTPSPTPPSPPASNRSTVQQKRIKVGISVSAVLVVGLSCYWIFDRWRRKKRAYKGENSMKFQEFPSIRLDLIIAATKQFSTENKLGEGGFGPVYKGILEDGKEIAVKKLSKTSSQGLQEFKNEVTLIAKLQHKNLVRLVGSCPEGEELLLVYEYMPNKSLDLFLFDPKESIQLDWKRRLVIINGVARGVLYLHEDSRLKIIHRDLKASNVLLDHEMNPKISDFGMARIFAGNQREANTKRIVGTYGYMAPEYAMEGIFSIKSDVFSYGVLLLEIICGKKSSGFYNLEHGQTLLMFAWKLWSNGEGLKLIDPVLTESCVLEEALKCIHIGLLCVQEDPADRPTMSSVVVMLVSDSIPLPQPTQPAFTGSRVVVRSAKSSENKKTSSVNEVTLSCLSPR